MAVNIDAGLRNADWINTMTWDLPITVDEFLKAIGGEKRLDHFMTLPAAEAMPASLRLQLMRKTGRLRLVKHGDHDQSTHGSWASGGSSGSGGSGTGAGTPEDPFVTTSVDAAITALSEGKYVDLHQERGLSTLTDKLADIGRDARARGEEAPKTYDLARVSINGTNIFMEDNLGIPRIEMPQLSGYPIPGSPADAMPKDERGGVDLAPLFVDHLEAEGVGLHGEIRPPDFLRASQDELDGVTVARIMSDLESGRVNALERGIWVTDDDYILDGHHQWAAVVALNAEGGDYPLITHVIEAPITTAMRMAEEWGDAMGIRRERVGKRLHYIEFKHGDHDQSTHGSWASGSDPSEERWEAAHTFSPLSKIPENYTSLYKDRATRDAIKAVMNLNVSYGQGRPYPNEAINMVARGVVTPEERVHVDTSIPGERYEDKYTAWLDADGKEVDQPWPYSFDDAQRDIEILDRAFEKDGARTTDDVVLYKGIDSKLLESLDSGDVLEDRGFSSVALYANEGLTVMAADPLKQSGMEVFVPRGFPMIVSDDVEYSEGLFPRGTQFRVVDEYIKREDFPDSGPYTGFKEYVRVVAIPPKAAKAHPRVRELKHGDHDQSSHGNWAEGGSGDLDTSYRDSWQPTMSPEEGHAWAKAAGTKVEQTVVHITDKESVGGISGEGFDVDHPGFVDVMHAEGAYFATTPHDAEFYSFKGVQAVSAAVVIQNPLEVDLTETEHSINVSDALVELAISRDAELDTLGATTISGTTFMGSSPGYSDADEFRARALDAAGLLKDNIFAIGSAEETTRVLREAGYDGVRITSPSPDTLHGGAVGGNQVIVFDREQAVVIGVTSTVDPDTGFAPESLIEAFDKRLRIRYGLKHGDHDQSSHGSWADDEPEPPDDGDTRYVATTLDIDTRDTAYDESQSEIIRQLLDRDNVDVDRAVETLNTIVWNASASNKNETAHALADWAEYGDTNIVPMYIREGDVLAVDDYLDVQYAATQQALEEAEVPETIELFRGISPSPSDEATVDSLELQAWKLEQDMREAESRGEDAEVQRLDAEWQAVQEALQEVGGAYEVGRPGVEYATTNPQLAAAFAGPDGSVYKITVPRSAVIYTSDTNESSRSIFQSAWPPEAMQDVPPGSEQEEFHGPYTWMDEWAIRGSDVQKAERVDEGYEATWLNYEQVGAKALTQDQLNAIRERFIHGTRATLRAGKKHGDHDQSTHGNWASGGGDDEEDGQSLMPTTEDHAPDIDTPEWSRVTKEIASQGMGNCYASAGTLMLNAAELGLQNPTIVQATVVGRGDLDGIPFGHAWLEADSQTITFPQKEGEPQVMTTRVAIDYASGNRVIMDATVYRMLGNVHDVYEFDAAEAYTNMVATESYGPWQWAPNVGGLEDVEPDEFDGGLTEDTMNLLEEDDD